MTVENVAVEDLTGRVAVVTGASSGIGLAAAAGLARRGFTISLVGRDPRRLAAAADTVRAAGTGEVRTYRCDFDDLREVRALAGELRAAHPRIDVLANNAGGAFSSRQVTVDGFERTIQVNHLAPFLLAHELRDPLRGGRLISTASAAHRSGGLDPTDLSSSHVDYGMLRVYGSAKQANILFTTQAAQMWSDILCVCFHPGVVRTRFGNESPLIAFYFRFMGWTVRTPEKGAETLIHLATAARAGLTQGGYYMDRQVRQPARKATLPKLAEELWTASAEAVGLS